MKFPLEKTMEQERPELLSHFQPNYWFKKHPPFYQSKGVLFPFNRRNSGCTIDNYKIFQLKILQDIITRTHFKLNLGYYISLGFKIKRR